MNSKNCIFTKKDSYGKQEDNKNKGQVLKLSRESKKTMMQSRKCIKHKIRNFRNNSNSYKSSLKTKKIKRNSLNVNFRKIKKILKTS
jgi:hypothetical protein